MNYHKYIKLTILYEYLFSEKCNQKHRALDDVILCSKCYFNMRD